MFSIGTKSAEYGHRAVLPLSLFSGEEVFIRTLGVGLVAIAAVAASLTLARHRWDQPQAPPSPAPEGPTTALDLNLEAIRAAGL
jgi:hypothetical protein